MKTLLLVRHAEAVSSTATGDFTRKLSIKGLQQATAVSEHLKANRITPQMVISSPASRTQATAKKLTEILGLPSPVYDESIYEASEDTLLGLINTLEDKYTFAALVGHNPGISYLLYNLTGKLLDVPPCTAVAITFDIDSWQSVVNKTGSILYHITPDLLPAFQ